MNTAAAAPPAQGAPRPAPGRPEKLRLGDVLVQQRLISQEQLQQTLELQRQTGKKVGRLLIESGVITEELLANGLARQLRIPFVNLKTFPFRGDVVKLLPESAARRFRALVLEDKGDALLVAGSIQLGSGQRNLCPPGHHCDGAATSRRDCQCADDHHIGDALAVVERAAGADVMRAPSGELLPLVRELARMELAEGQTREVLELLKRLEPALAGQADLWAVRANAAQRLGSHQEAIHAYQTALTLRPGESRWMLGTAVSLAARGQTAAALELAEKARATGTVSSDVVAYLRQLGVSLKD